MKVGPGGEDCVVLSRRIASAELLRAFRDENPTLPSHVVTRSDEEGRGGRPPSTSAIGSNLHLPHGTASEAQNRRSGVAVGRSLQGMDNPHGDHAGW